MYVAFVLRRKREGIAGTIAAYEARIDAAKMDLAVLEQSARCSIPKPNEARHLPLASGQGQARQRSRRQSVRIHGVCGAPVHGVARSPSRAGAARRTREFFFLQTAITH